MNLPPRYTNWLEALFYVARHYGIGASKENVRVTLSWEQNASLDKTLEHMARQLGLTLRLDELSDAALNAWRLPLVVELENEEVCVVRSNDGQGRLGVLLGGDQGLETSLSIQELRQRAKRIAILRPSTGVQDARVDDYIRPYTPNWFWSIALRDWRRYGDIVLASVFANVLALAGMVFSMQIYDRVVPAQSEPTLWVLFGGVMLAVAFEFLLRMSRTHISDVIGKRADLKISDLIFGHALRVRNDARSRSTGSFIAQVRETEQVRELLTSTTIGAVADLPFFIFFLAIMWMVAGPLALVALAAVPLLVIPGLLIQKPLSRLANQGMRESALRNALLVEVVEGIEDIKLMRAEPRFQNQWNHVNDVSADISMRQRFLTGLLMTWTQEVQTIVYAVVLLVGCLLVMKGEMTTGTLVGASILASRMIAPLAQLSGVFARWQQAKIARVGLDQIMQRPVDQAATARRVHMPVVRGEYSLKSVEFQYNKEDRDPALSLARLKIQAGEKIAVLGRMGAGKSTLLQLLAGLYTPQQGQITLDAVNLAQIDPADLRRDMGLLTQNARLFHGTIRENILMGMPLASDAQVLEMLEMVGAMPFLRSRSDGLDELIHEGGLGLSGGQRQALLLARTLIRQPSIVLLDEPTAHFDEVTERQAVEAMQDWLEPRTLIVATHRLPLLKWVDRIIVMEGGRIAMDGTKEQILGKISRDNT